MPPGVMSGAFNPYFMASVLEFVHFPAKFTFCRIVWQIWMRLMGLMAISTLIKFLPRVTALPFRIAAREPSFEKEGKMILPNASVCVKWMMILFKRDPSQWERACFSWWINIRHGIWPSYPMCVSHSQSTALSIPFCAGLRGKFFGNSLCWFYASNPPTAQACPPNMQEKIKQNVCSSEETE